jgi:pantoate--beta-alanine ligase
VVDLSFDLKLISFPTVREADGLAMSSRNRRLSAEARETAPHLYTALQLGMELLAQSQPVAIVKEQVLQYLASKEVIRLEYFDVVDAQTLQPLEGELVNQKVALCIAAWLSEVRLIDNVVVRLDAAK